MREAPYEPVDITSPRFKANPYLFYAKMRASQPVCRIRLSRKEDAFLVARYDDVSAILKEPRLAKDPVNALTQQQQDKLRKPPKMLAPLTRNMLGLDDPDHARLKRLVQAVFTPPRVRALEDQARIISTELLDQLIGRGNFDLIADYALPLSVTVISDLLGVPKQDQTRFARWSHTLIKNGTPSLATLFALPDIFAFMRYLRRLIDMKRQDPQDDLVSALVQAEEAGDKLNSDELLAMIAILLSAGHETTTNLIGNGILALIDHPDAARSLTRKPEMIDTGVEELLRFASPVFTSTHRYAREPLVIAGAEIPRGSLVFGLISSANRDQDQFTAANELDVARTSNRHLTFGEGGHYCVGAALARLEGKIAIQDLLARFSHMRLGVARDRIRWKPGVILNGLTRLPISTRAPPISTFPKFPKIQIKRSF